MAGDWIKMRVWLSRDPKVIAMANYLAYDRDFMNWLTDPVQQSCRESAFEHNARNVIVALCINALLVTWGTAREQGDRENDDLVINHADLLTIDSITDIPGFGDAMHSVGWAEEREETGALVFPCFFKETESPDDRYRRQNAKRQAKYREKRRNESNVTVASREEKRRVNRKPPDNASLLSGGLPVRVKSAHVAPEAKNPTERSDKPPNGSADLNTQAREVLAFLNRYAGRDFQDVDANLDLIKARLHDGATVTQCRQVIVRKCEQWAQRPEMAPLLRPKTLFDPINFANYRGELVLPAEESHARH